MILSKVSKITGTTVSTYHCQNPLNLNEFSGYDDIPPVLFTDFNGKQATVASTPLTYCWNIIYLHYPPK